MADVSERTTHAQSSMGEPPYFLANGGEVGAIILSRDWTDSPIGLPLHWPPELKTLINVMLNAGQPMFITWGETRTLLYNDAFIEIVGDKHPESLGQPFHEVFAEAWDTVSPLFQTVSEGRAVHMDDITVTLDRRSRPTSEAHFVFSYTPVRDANGAVKGLYCACTETTEQVFAQRRLEAERQRQRRLLQQMPGFVAVLSGPTHVYQYVNDAYVRIAGPRGFIGRGVRDVFPELHDQGFFERLDEVYLTGEAFAMSSAPLRLSGEDEDRRIDLLYEPIRDDAGQVTGIFVGGYDVTQAHRTAESLRQSEAYIRLLLASTSEGFYAVDCHGNTTLCNAAFLSMLGFDNEAQALGLRLHEVIHHSHPGGEHYPFRECPIFQCASEGKSAHVTDEVFFRVDGSSLPVEYWVHPIIRHGRLDGALCTFIDVTEQRRTRAALLELNETLERRVEERTRERDRAWNNSQDLQAVLGLNGIFRAVNTAWTTVLEWKPEEVVGRHYLEFIHPEDRAFSADALSATVMDDASAIENRCQHKDGSYRWVSWVGAPEDKLIYASGRHITAEKEAAAALETTQAQLRQSQKLEAVGQLTGGVAHDFNNLLTIICGSVEMLRRPTTLESRRPRYVEAIADAASRATKLTGQLLAFARRQALKPEVFDVVQSVLSVTNIIRTLTGSHIVLTVELPEEPCLVCADPSQFDTALLNLAVNARDAMEGGGKLTIQVRNVSQMPPLRGQPMTPGEFVAVTVADSGRGIPADNLDEIFEPFFTTKPVGHGTGLGLSQVFGFSKQSGGEVQVLSEQGQGAAFTLYLPRVHGELSTAERTEVPQVAPAGARLQVLVVEDNEEVGAFSTQALQELGHTTLLVANALEALAVLAENASRFDVVFSDVVMPGMSGIELGQEIRRLYRDLPVVLTSGYSHVLAQSGTFGFELLHKPYSMEELARTLHKSVVWHSAQSTG
jgi:PAS domain S-box-containing protein